MGGDHCMNDANFMSSAATISRRRFFAPPSAFDFKEGIVTLDSDESHHLRKVLRLTAGDQVFVFDGEGREFACVVEGRAEEDVAPLRRRQNAFIKLDIEKEVQPARPESPLDLTLAVALLKGEKLDTVVQKATELGVKRIAFIETKRADVRTARDPKDAMRRIERFRRLALEAAKQSGRARLPIITEPIDFASFVEGKHNTDVKHLMFSEREGRSLKEVFSERSTRHSIVALVGAEGGWETEEIALARQNSWQIITLGGRIMRAETAAITVVALLQHLYGDLI
jgi:16S rRNA (uracil1498-N3)-methyltransferase